MRVFRFVQVFGSKNRLKLLKTKYMAEREGFEPPIAFRLCLISSQVHSTGLCHLSAVKRHFLSRLLCASLPHICPDAAGVHSGPLYRTPFLTGQAHSAVQAELSDEFPVMLRQPVVRYYADAGGGTRTGRSCRDSESGWSLEGCGNSWRRR